MNYEKNLKTAIDREIAIINEIEDIMTETLSGNDYYEIIINRGENINDIN